ncbi:MAG: hypothetical protein N2578_09235, partial [Bdellovibrionaceae bacterium]|nr:hypothetical protein [Pseudobdellovibrionaceae bacterium]
LILSTSLSLAAVLLVVGWFALKSFRLQKRDADFDLKSHEGKVVSVSNDGREGQMDVMGETWFFRSDLPLAIGDRVQLLEREGMIYKVKKKEKTDV